jgi:fatty-acyl-CoA synthase
VGERRLGELVAEGASISPGYFADRPRTPRTRLHTGDLGYVADGHVYVVDRIKDLVIVNGQNYAPSDIESAAAEVAGLRRGRIVAFSTPGDGGSEALHLVAEASPDTWRAPAEIEAAVRQRIRRDIGLSVATVTVVVPGTLERTSSGKVRRRACADAHRDGTLVTVRGRSDLLAYQVGRRGTLVARAAAGAVGALGRIGARLAALRR